MAGQGSANFCAECNSIIKKGESALLCDGFCKLWHHLKCLRTLHLDNEVIKTFISGGKVKWFCVSCDKRLCLLKSSISSHIQSTDNISVLDCVLRELKVNNKSNLELLRMVDAFVKDQLEVKSDIKKLSVLFTNLSAHVKTFFNSNESAHTSRECDVNFGNAGSINENSTEVEVLSNNSNEVEILNNYCNVVKVLNNNSNEVEVLNNRSNEVEVLNNRSNEVEVTTCGNELQSSRENNAGQLPVFDATDNSDRSQKALAAMGFFNEKDMILREKQAEVKKIVLPTNEISVKKRTHTAIKKSYSGLSKKSNANKNIESKINSKHSDSCAISDEQVISNSKKQPRIDQLSEQTEEFVELSDTEEEVTENEIHVVQQKPSNSVKEQRNRMEMGKKTISEFESLLSTRGVSLIPSYSQQEIVNEETEERSLFQENQNSVGDCQIDSRIDVNDPFGNNNITVSDSMSPVNHTLTVSTAEPRMETTVNIPPAVDEDGTYFKKEIEWLDEYRENGGDINDSQNSELTIKHEAEDPLILNEVEVLLEVKGEKLDIPTKWEGRSPVKNMGNINHVSEQNMDSVEDSVETSDSLFSIGQIRFESSNSTSLAASSNPSSSTPQTGQKSRSGPIVKVFPNNMPGTMVQEGTSELHSAVQPVKVTTPVTVDQERPTSIDSDLDSSTNSAKKPAVKVICRSRFLQSLGPNKVKNLPPTYTDAVKKAVASAFLKHHDETIKSAKGKCCEKEIYTGASILYFKISEQDGVINVTKVPRVPVKQKKTGINFLSNAESSVKETPESLNIVQTQEKENSNENGVQPSFTVNKTSGVKKCYLGPLKRSNEPTEKVQPHSSSISDASKQITLPEVGSAKDVISLDSIKSIHSYSKPVDKLYSHGNTKSTAGSNDKKSMGNVTLNSLTGKNTNVCQNVKENMNSTKMSKEVTERQINELRVLRMLSGTHTSNENDSSTIISDDEITVTAQSFRHTDHSYSKGNMERNISDISTANKSSNSFVELSNKSFRMKQAKGNFNENVRQTDTRQNDASVRKCRKRSSSCFRITEDEGKLKSFKNTAENVRRSRSSSKIREETEKLSVNASEERNGNENVRRSRSCSRLPEDNESYFEETVNLSERLRRSQSCTRIPEDKKPSVVTGETPGTSMNLRKSRLYSKHFQESLKLSKNTTKETYGKMNLKRNTSYSKIAEKPGKSSTNSNVTMRKPAEKLNNKLIEKRKSCRLRSKDFEANSPKRSRITITSRQSNRFKNYPDKSKTKKKAKIIVNSCTVCNRVFTSLRHDSHNRFNSSKEDYRCLSCSRLTVLVGGM